MQQISNFGRFHLPQILHLQNLTANRQLQLVNHLGGEEPFLLLLFIAHRVESLLRLDAKMAEGKLKRINSVFEKFAPFHGQFGHLGHVLLHANVHNASFSQLYRKIRMEF